jgi:hypothetical protein
MGWFLLAQLFSTLAQLIHLSRMSGQEKDLELMILRTQLDVAERKLHKPVRPTELRRSRWPCWWSG